MPAFARMGVVSKEAAMKKTYTITYPLSYLKGTNKELTVIGTIEQAKRFAEVYGRKIGFSGAYFIREAAA